MSHDVNQSRSPNLNDETNKLTLPEYAVKDVNFDAQISPAGRFKGLPTAKFLHRSWGCRRVLNPKNLEVWGYGTRFSRTAFSPILPIFSKAIVCY